VLNDPKGVYECHCWKEDRHCRWGARRTHAGRLRQSGFFGCAATLPESAAAKNPTVKIARVRTQPDASKLREFADDVRDGKFVLPIGRRMPLPDAQKHMLWGRKSALGISFCWRLILRSEKLASWARSERVFEDGHAGAHAAACRKRSSIFLSRFRATSRASRFP
jgi:hypothetical protein